MEAPAAAPVIADAAEVVAAVVAAPVAAHPSPANPAKGIVISAINGLHNAIEHMPPNSPVPSTPVAPPVAPPVSALNPQQPEDTAEVPQHIFLPFTPCAVTFATTCRSYEPHFGQVIPPAETFFSGSSPTSFIGVRQCWQKFESSGMVFPHFLHFIEIPSSLILIYIIFISQRKSIFIVTV